MKRIPLADLHAPPGSRLCRAQPGQPCPGSLLTHDRAREAMRAELRARLAVLDAVPAIGPARALGHLADGLRVSEHQVKLALRSARIGPELAEALGYRKIVRFERVE